MRRKRAHTSMNAEILSAIQALTRALQHVPVVEEVAQSDQTANAQAASNPNMNQARSAQTRVIEVERNGPVTIVIK